MNQIINIIIRQVMSRLIRQGINMGMNKAGDMAQRRKASQGEPMAPEQEMTPQERRQKRLANQQARQARQQLKATRRISRF